MLARRFFYVSLGILALSIGMALPAHSQFAATELPAYLPFDACGGSATVEQWRGRITPQSQHTLVLSSGNGIYLYDGVTRQVLYTWISPGGTVWRVVIDDIDGDGLEEVIVLTRSGSCALSGSHIIEWTGPATDVGSASPMSQDLALKQNAPNPAAASTDIAFTLPEAGTAELAIYDPGGRLVRRLVEGSLTAGAHRVSWDGHDDRGNDAASGVYFYRLSYAGQTETEKMIVLR
jgi:hypothetical protein